MKKVEISPVDKRRSSMVNPNFIKDAMEQEKCVVG